MNQDNKQWISACQRAKGKFEKNYDKYNRCVAKFSQNFFFCWFLCQFVNASFSIDINMNSFIALGIVLITVYVVVIFRYSILFFFC